MTMAKSLVILSLVLLSTGSAAAQDRWSPWLGCWTPAESTRRSEDVRICVVPSADRAGVRMITFAGEQAMLDETVVADGTRHAVTDNDCAGARTSRWAARGPRLLTVTELQCAGQPVQQSSGVSVLTGANAWLDIQVSSPAGREVIRTRRYTRSTAPPPPAVAGAIDALPAVAAIGEDHAAADDVIEASAVVSPRAVEAWLVETEPKVALDRRALVRLADARVPEPVIDLLVALAYPRRFDVHRPSSGSASSGGGAILVEPDGLSPWQTWAGPWALDPYSYSYAPFLPWGAFDAYSFYMPYDQGGYIIVGGGPVPPVAASHGQVVNGQGYTRVQPHVEAVASEGGRGSAGGTASTAGADAGGGLSSGGASPAGYSDGGGGGATGLTAVPR